MVRRHLAAVVRGSLKDFPAVLLLGARQVGKSTLAMELVGAGVLERYVTLDDLATLEAAREDPDGFVARLPGPVALDEIQKVPDLMRALKKSIDKDRSPGRFLLTSSANLLALPAVSESLGGRVDVIHLEGLSRREVANLPTGASSLERLLQAKTWDEPLEGIRKVVSKLSPLAKAELQALVFYGGFPEVVLKRSPRFTERWFSSYVTTYVERDVRDIARLSDVVAFGKLVRLAGLQTANLLNNKNLAVDAGLDQRTAARYLEILEVTFQAERLAPWQANVRKRLVKTPKLYVQDSGLACHLAGVTSPRDLDGHPAWGALFETWARAELRKATAQTSAVFSSFYRTHQGKEVDFVLEKGRRRLGVEVKSAKSCTSSDFAGLRDMQEATGNSSRGMMLYGGEEVVSFSKGLVAVPWWGIL
ncbi:MAG: ATP-binding protein [Planctomycetota bacterium]|jgi:predicted AAA+ superfamily ATPase